ncbi:hypothetical protein EQP49_22630 [Yersinia sp. 2105 StPb PI]|nr:hypothetical protein EQP49_22630 [Yersinia sp. 2105 StPb PI]
MSALAPFWGAYERVISSFSDTAYSSAEFSYNTHCKATLFRAVGPGRGGFLMGKGARWFQMCTVWCLSG